MTPCSILPKMFRISTKSASEPSMLVGVSPASAGIRPSIHSCCYFFVSKHLDGSRKERGFPCLDQVLILRHPGIAPAFTTSRTTLAK